MEAREKHVYDMKNRIKSVQENDWQRNWCWINSHVSVREYAYEIRIKSVQGKWLRKSWIIIKLKSPYKNAQALGYIQLTFFWWHLRKLSYQIVMQHKLPCSVDIQIASDSCKRRHANCLWLMQVANCLWLKQVKTCKLPLTHTNIDMRMKNKNHQIFFV